MFMHSGVDEGLVFIQYSDLFCLLFANGYSRMYFKIQFKRLLMTFCTN